MTVQDKVRRERMAARVGGWAFALTGAGHLTLASLMPATDDMLAVERQMEQARFPMTPSHSVADLMQGFSLVMAVLLVACGVSVLLMTRHGRAAERAQVALMLALSLALLGIALLLLPAPPIVLMTVACAAFAVALHASLRTVTPASTASSPDASPTAAGR
jgi:phosphotransferase system  glucose/maltose/N-acetylglucosamine-specific IIC component